MYIYCFYELDSNDESVKIPRYVGISDNTVPEKVWIGSQPETGSLDYNHHRTYPEYYENGFDKYQRMWDFGCEHPDSNEYLKAKELWHDGEGEFETRSKTFVKWIKNKRCGEDFTVEVLHKNVSSKEFVYFLEYYYVNLFGKKSKGGTLLNYDDGGMTNDSKKNKQWPYAFSPHFLLYLTEKKALVWNPTTVFVGYNKEETNVKTPVSTPRYDKIVVNSVLDLNKRVNEINKKLQNYQQRKEKIKKRGHYILNQKKNKSIKLTKKVLAVVKQSNYNYHIFKEAFPNEWLYLKNMKKTLRNRTMKVSIFNKLELGHPQKTEILKQANYY